MASVFVLKESVQHLSFVTVDAQNYDFWIYFH